MKKIEPTELEKRGHHWNYFSQQNESWIKYTEYAARNFKLSWKEVRNWNGVLNLLEMRARMELLPKLNQSPLPQKRTEKMTLINTAMCIMWREHVMWIHVLCALLQTQWSARCHSWSFLFYVYECGWHAQYFDHLCGQKRIKIPEILSQYYAKLHVTDSRKGP